MKRERKKTVQVSDHGVAKALSTPASKHTGYTFMPSPKKNEKENEEEEEVEQEKNDPMKIELFAYQRTNSTIQHTACYISFHFGWCIQHSIDTYKHTHIHKHIHNPR